MSMDHQDYGISQPNMPPRRSPQIDPDLSLYPSYDPYQQPQQHTGHHLSLSKNLSSPSSQGSDTIGTPPTENMPYPSSNTNDKRPSSPLVGGLNDNSRKKAHTDDGTDGQSPSAEKEEPKPKSTRGSRRLKMKCVVAEQGPPCKRCIAGNRECIFEESSRRRRSKRTLDTTLNAFVNLSMASGMVSRSPSPSGQTAQTQALLASPSPPPQQPYLAQGSVPSMSSELHSLPDSSLDPLGLLVEEGLANRSDDNSATSTTVK
ncbi:hypothetical protein F5I97DRAFT_1828349 [Phlebopus sp. FC_14]|nr:hypothetical protein F5I97DRAFT_1828349 [Phlebopus sp. FC_14]